MPRENITDIIAFLAVAQERSFTRAAAGSASHNQR
jgi:DNA-binding transcriptional LysR family regulator